MATLAMRKVRLVCRCSLMIGLPVVLALSAGCGTQGSRVTVATIRRSTFDVQTAHFEVSIGPPGSVRGRLYGDAELSAGRYRWTVPSKDSSIQFVVIGDRGYTRHFLGLPSSSWCQVEIDLFNFDPARVVGSLKAGSRLERIGNDTTRGTPTVHYRLLNDGMKPEDLWIDSVNRLRRLIASDDLTGDLSIDFYDFGVDLKRITQPETASPCL